MNLTEYQDLRGLAKQWRASSKEYTQAMLVCAPVDKPRYEGLATAYRWAAEDLATFCDHHQPSRKKTPR